MPNHVTNIVTFVGTEEQVKELMDCILVDVNGEPQVDFNTFAPMPKELENTTAPAKIVSQEDYDKMISEHEEMKSKLGLLNANENLSEEEKKDKDLLEHKLDYFSMPITQEMSDKYISEFGTNNWYDWKCSNWGTKWCAYDTFVSDTNIVIFQTAWSTPYAAMLALSEKFPNVTIQVEFADEDFGHNVGEYSILNCEVEENIPDGGSVDAIRMAMDIQGDEDYYTGEYFDEYNEDELREDIKNNSFVQGLLQYFFEEKITYPSNQIVTDYLIIMAIENEDFEYADLLKQERDEWIEENPTDEDSE